VVGIFVAYFSTRLRDIYFSITTLVFSQIFYVIIFTWTDGHRRRERLTFPSRRSACGPGLGAFTPALLHWFVLAVVTLSYLLLPPRHAVTVRHGAAVDP
jgi:ABC-type branched-subunit amino acid transport system permease subunit